MTIPYPRRSLQSRVFWSTLNTLTQGVAHFWPNPKQYVPVVEQVRIPIADLPESLNGMTIAQMSDFHAGRHVYPQTIRRAAHMVMELKPDLIALTGDFIHRDVTYAAGCADALSSLRAPLGVHAVLGNHDYWHDGEAVAAALTRGGLPPLRNEARRLVRGDTAFYIVGIDDVRFRKADLRKAIRALPPEATKIVLVHEPDIADSISEPGVVLQLSGHSHGGQICLPGMRPVLKPSGGRKYPSGLDRTASGLWVYTNRGIGVAMPPVRINCPAEISLLTLTRQKSTN